MIIEVYIEKQKNEKKSGIVTAFYSAYFSKHEKLSGSDLQRVLDSVDNAQEEMSDEEMYATVKRICAAFGEVTSCR